MVCTCVLSAFVIIPTFYFHTLAVAAIRDEARVSGVFPALLRTMEDIGDRQQLLESLAAVGGLARGNELNQRMIAELGGLTQLVRILAWSDPSEDFLAMVVNAIDLCVRGLCSH